MTVLLCSSSQTHLDTAMPSGANQTAKPVRFSRVSASRSSRTSLRGLNILLGGILLDGAFIDEIERPHPDHVDHGDLIRRALLAMPQPRDPRLDVSHRKLERHFPNARGLTPMAAC